MDDKQLKPTHAVPNASRRHTLMLGVAGAATLAGAGWALRNRETALNHAGHEAAVTPHAAANLPIWALKFDAPVGDAVVMAVFRGKPLLLNFWATWCPPCVQELPLLSRFYQENKSKSWQVLGIAIDQPSAVVRFLGKSHLSFPVAMAGLEGTEISRSLGNQTGSLPFTVVFDANGSVVHRKMGTLDATELQSLLASYTPR